MTILDYYVEQFEYKPEVDREKPNELDARFIFESTLKELIKQTCEKNSIYSSAQPTAHEIYHFVRKHIVRVRWIADIPLIDVDEHRMLPSYNLFINKHTQILEYSEEILTEMDKLSLLSRKKKSELALKAMYKCTRLAKASRD